MILTFRRLDRGTTGRRRPDNRKASNEVYCCTKRIYATKEVKGIFEIINDPEDNISFQKPSSDSQI